MALQPWRAGTQPYLSQRHPACCLIATSVFAGDLGRHDRRNRSADAHPGRHNRSLRLGKTGEKPL
jgi:hypothetical protein